MRRDLTLFGRIAAVVMLAAVFVNPLYARHNLHGQELEQLLHCLDNELDVSCKYVDERLRRIDFLHRMHDMTVVTDHLHYDMNRKL